MRQLRQVGVLLLTVLLLCGRWLYCWHMLCTCFVHSSVYMLAHMGSATQHLTEQLLLSQCAGAMHAPMQAAL